jgi:hypothetical protein
MDIYYLPMQLHTNNDNIVKVKIIASACYAAVMEPPHRNQLSV